jgi:hypothetical protein
MAIVCQCDECGREYRIRDELAGKRVKCKECGAPISIPRPGVETSNAGDRILRHQRTNRPSTTPASGGQSAELIGAHFREILGTNHAVIHEIVSEFVHIDILIFRPSEEYPFYTLVSSGMSDQPMLVPPDVTGGEFAELVLLLPSDWPMSRQTWDENEAEYYWPISWLKRISRLPHEYDTWLSNGHTIPNGDPPQPFSPNTELCCWMLAPPIYFPEECWTLQASRSKEIEFHLMLPLYEEEVDFKLERGPEELMERLGKLDDSFAFDFDRRNACKKRFGRR